MHRANPLASFLAHGYPTMLAIENRDDFNPQYHTPGDRVQVLNLNDYADVTHATIARLAVPLH